MNKPGYKTTELYLAIAAVGALVWVLQQLQTDLPAMLASGPTWAVGLVPMAQLGIGAAIAGLGKWYMDHRKAIKLMSPLAISVTGNTMQGTVGPIQTAGQLGSSSAGRVQIGMLLLLCGLTLTAPMAFGCAHMTPFEQETVKCAEGEGADLVAQLIPLLLKQDWPDAITAAVKSGSEATICALQFIATQQSTASGSYAAPANAKAWLEAHQVTVKVK